MNSYKDCTLAAQPRLRQQTILYKCVHFIWMLNMNKVNETVSEWIIRNRLHFSCWFYNLCNVKNCCSAFSFLLRACYNGEANGHIIIIMWTVTGISFECVVGRKDGTQSVAKYIVIIISFSNFWIEIVKKLWCLSRTDSTGFNQFDRDMSAHITIHA